MEQTQTNDRRRKRETMSPVVSTTKKGFGRKCLDNPSSGDAKVLTRLLYTQTVPKIVEFRPDPTSRVVFMTSTTYGPLNNSKPRSSYVSFVVSLSHSVLRIRTETENRLTYRNSPWELDVKKLTLFHRRLQGKSRFYDLKFLAYPEIFLLYGLSYLNQQINLLQDYPIL